MRLNPAHGLLRSNAALVAGEAGVALRDPTLLEQAQRAHAAVLASAPTYWLYWRSAGFTAYQAADYARGVQYLRTATGLFDRDPTSWTVLGASAALGDIPTARASFTRALELAPDDPQARDALARLPPS